jgi:lysine/ornithine N-monooxygenase
MEGNDSIRTTFNERFERIFNKHPSRFEFCQVFNWLESEAKNARNSEAINTVDELRRESESYFCRFRNLREDAEERSKKVNKIPKETSEKLREKETSFEVTTKGIKKKKSEGPTSRIVVN